MSEKLSFVFFGSGPVAAKSLQFLSSTFSIEAVITKPSTEQEMSAVVKGVPVYCIKTRAELDELTVTKRFTSRLGVLIDFGVIISRKVIDSFELGIVNSHFSVLPDLRGADPITFAILSGQKQTGVSLMLLVEAMDEGPLIAFREYDIPKHATTPQLTDELIKLSNGLLTTELPSYMKNPSDVKSQDSTGRETSYSRKLLKEDGLLRWNKPAELLERELRAYAAWPKSRANFAGIDCVVLSAEVIDKKGEAGSLFVHDKELGVYCEQKSLVIKSLKPAGKKEMSSQAFLAGYRQRLGI